MIPFETPIQFFSINIQLVKTKQSFKVRQEKAKLEENLNFAEKAL